MTALEARRPRTERVLLALYHQGPMHRSKISARIGDDWGAAVDTLTSLQARGLVARDPAPGALDGLGRHRLTDLGRARCHALNERDRRQLRAEIDGVLTGG